MIEVFKIVRDFYPLEAAVKLNFNTFSSTRENKYKLQKPSGARKMADLKMTDQIVRKMGDMKLADLKMAEQKKTVV